jgi:hypothetical protein
VYGETRASGQLASHAPDCLHFDVGCQHGHSLHGTGWTMLLGASTSTVREMMPCINVWLMIGCIIDTVKRCLSVFLVSFFEWQGNGDREVLPKGSQPVDDRSSSTCLG